MILIVCILSAYNLLLLLITIGWRKRTAPKSFDKGVEPVAVSVVVAIRNEEQNISQLIESLANQVYPRFEVILVDDHSTDGTVAIASALNSGFTLIPNKGVGKKSALETGIAAARGEIIVTTDADCQMGPLWLQAVTKVFRDSSVKLAFGAVAIASNESFFSKLQTLEFASVIGSGAAAAAWRVPFICNGANLAFRKIIFEHVNGYEGNRHVASGDDEFLMRKVLNAYPQGVTFVSDPQSTVITLPVDSFRTFADQRFRWASKWRYNTSIFAICLALFIFLTQVALLAAMISAATGATTILVLLAIRMLLEAWLIRSVCLFCKVKWSTAAFICLQVVYPIYVLYIGLFANFAKPAWKGRKMSLPLLFL